MRPHRYTYALLHYCISALNALWNINGSIGIKWKTAIENNIVEYILEKSADAITFKPINNKSALMNNGTEANYYFKDISPFYINNFYRIKIVFVNGTIKYSNVVKLAAFKNEAEIVVYPNPVTGRSLNLNFANQLFGSYKIVLVNEADQQVWTSSVLYSNNSGGKIMLELPKNVAAGNYHLSFIDKDGKSFKISFILL